MMGRALRILLLLLAGGVFAPGLTGPFLLDDGVNLVDSIEFAEGTRLCSELDLLGLSSHSGPLGRPVAMLSFALNHCVHGFDPFLFKLTSLALHLATAGVVLLLVHLLLCTPRFLRNPLPPPIRATLPWLVALGWLVMPLHVSTVLYVVQRMTILAALFTLLGLCLYLQGRRLLLGAKTRGALACFAGAAFVCLPLAALSKENGLLLPLLCLVVEFACFGPAERSRAFGRMLGAGVLAGVLALGLATWLKQAQIATWLDGLYAYRDFTLPERLATETVVLAWYVWMSFAPDLGQMGIFHDDFPVLHVLRDPIVVVVGAGWLLALLLALRLRERAPWLLFGLGLFLAGHAMEGTFLPLELVFEHRNYLPSVGLITAGMMLLAILLRTRQALFLAACLAWIATTAAATATRSAGWVDILDLHARELANHPGSERATVGLAGVFHEAYRVSGDVALGEQALALFERALAHKPHSIPALLGRLMLLSDLGRDTRLALQQAQERLAAPRIHPAVATLIGQIMDTTAQGEGALDGMQVAALAAAVLDNPTVLASIRVDLAIRLAIFYANAAGDFAAAMRVLDGVSEAAGDPFEIAAIRYRLHQAAGTPGLPGMREGLWQLAEQSANPLERARRRALLEHVFRDTAPSPQAADAQGHP